MFKKIVQKLKGLNREQLKKMEDISDNVWGISATVFLIVFVIAFMLNIMEKPVNPILIIILIIAAVIVALSLLCILYFYWRQQKL